VFNTEEVALRLQVVGLARPDALAVARLVFKWITCMGEAETVKRIKSMKVDLLHRYAGLPPLKKDLWIKYTPSGPKGPFKAVFRSADFKTAWNAIMVYTQLVFTDPDVYVTDEQWNDLWSAVQRPSVEPEALIHGLAICHESPLCPKLELTTTTGSRLLDYHPNPSRRAPSYWPSAGTLPEVETILSSVNVLSAQAVHTVANMDILAGTVEGLEDTFATQLELNMIDEYKSGPVDWSERPDMGTVSLLQEGGYKLRFAANPHRVWQAALQPLGDALRDSLRSVDNDCTFDHERGVELVKGWLSQGMPARSTDLSNATDRAPLAFQLEYLSRLGVPTRWLQFYKSCCEGDWRITKTRRPRQYRKIRWTVGAPLGVYPVFFSFSLWHHAVVQAAFQRLRRRKVRVVITDPRTGVSRVSWVYPYVLLGDDRVIMDNEVDDLVVSWMRSWGMKIADHKSLTSDSVAEFAGRIITKDKVVKGFKWKGPLSDESFVDFARQMGPRSLLLARPRHRKVLSFIADLPEPMGLGWNPFGIPLQERLNHSIEAAFNSDERRRTFSNRETRTNRLLYMSEWATVLASGKSFPPINVRVPPDPDQGFEHVLKAMLPGLVDLGEAVWPNLPHVALVRGVPEEAAEGYRALLRSHSVVERRSDVSTLEMLERKIRRVLRHSR